MLAVYLFSFFHLHPWVRERPFTASHKTGELFSPVHWVRMVWVRRSLKSHLIPNPLPGPGTPSTGPGCSKLQVSVYNCGKLIYWNVSEAVSTISVLHYFGSQQVMAYFGNIFIFGFFFSDVTNNLSVHGNYIVLPLLFSSTKNFRNST